MPSPRAISLGASLQADGSCRFRVWAPRAKSLEVHFIEPADRLVALESRGNGYFEATIADVQAGSLYFYRIDNDKERPDPASRMQPRGVHGPSAVVDPQFAWTDAGWFGLPLDDCVVYEMHVGTFTPEGTLDAAIGRLDDLKNLGVTAVELMPLAQFPGGRNWGYDGVQLYAVQDSYGGPTGLKRFVDACHQRGLAVIVDAVYNHLGPEGNYLWDYGYYFTDHYKTPWGSAVNFDDAHSDPVRRYFIDNALYWQTEMHVDALRLDAIHAIYDNSAHPFLQQLAEECHAQAEALNRRFYLIAESSLNDTRIIRPPELGGFGLDSQWSDDFHHSVHTLLTGESAGYYVDYGKMADLAKFYRNGFTFTGQHSPYRRRCHGNDPRSRPARQFVICSQNHDQIGNRMLGDRRSTLLGFDALKLAAAATILSPYIPMLFMGEEYGETAPFLFFTSHGDEQLVEAVRKGRKEEFASFNWQGEVPDPQSEETFQKCKLNWKLRDQGHHRVLLEFYRECLRLRKTHPVLAHLDKDQQEIQFSEVQKSISMRRWLGEEQVLLAMNFGTAVAEYGVALPEGNWQVRLDSTAARWQGSGEPLPDSIHSNGEVTLTLSPLSCVLLERAKPPAE